MSLGLIIFLIFVGLLLFIIEFMLIPGVTIATLRGATNTPAGRVALSTSGKATDGSTSGR